MFDLIPPARTLALTGGFGRLFFCPRYPLAKHRCRVGVFGLGVRELVKHPYWRASLASAPGPYGARRCRWAEIDSDVFICAEV